ncbi:kinesin motor protein cin8 [Tulasnella sp. JGI-2019a]|nr:kinesin motor protein cin8 [Tulasnella sp. JGI-2019a]
MATRRPQITNVRSKAAIPTASSRIQRIQPSRSATSNDLEFEPQPEASTSSSILQPLMLASPSKRLGVPGAQSQVEMNVQVVVRCRIRSEREINENSAIIVSTQGARSEEITIETAIPTSNLGIYSPPPTRTYPFDRVFGPEADQTMIYNDVVQPLLDEVVSGYNCTLFAYGQTGTGKTYTMQGDLTPSVTGGPCAEAGMIPRVLSRLYQHLESSVADYSVKISYIELYNEELRDLLAPELSAPAGSAQPMGAGARSAEGTLKIFDEAGTGKRGVMIQGLDETLAKDFNHAIALLRKGSHRRQIAATKFNEHSSRSHSVFTITVHTKETSSKGDDTLRVGKLNLVDLAGSENIGRSGAENKRAREAGMINQSLLTLGRVINALVDQSPHVPYRESKLTRLLQDSLGGRTKTCIIATVSPARSNMEETLSTLDYAIRAKSIRNKPEVNQRMTRNLLLKEFVAEIDKLKSDLLAAREKNGIFFSKESWQEMSEEHEQMKTLHEESKRQVEIISTQMRAVREEFEQGMGLLMRSEGELKETRDRLGRTAGELKSTEGELKVVRRELGEEKYVSGALKETEGRLNGVAGSLRDVVKESVGNVRGLEKKLDRKTAVFASNSKAVLDHGRSVGSLVQEMEITLNKSIAGQVEVSQGLKQQALGLRTSEAEALSRHSAFIAQQLTKLTDSIEAIKAKDAAESQAVVALGTAVRTTTETIVTRFSNWESSLKESLDALVNEVGTACEAGVGTATTVFRSAVSLVDAVVLEAKSFVDEERTAFEELREVTEQAASSEISRLQNQNKLLTQLLDSEKIKAERMRDDLIKQVSSLLVGFTEARDTSMREAVGAVREDIVEGQREIAQYAGRVEGTIGESVSRMERVNERMEGRGAEGRRVKDGGLKALSTVTATMKNGLATMREGVTSAVEEESSWLASHVESTEKTYTVAVERLDRSKRARVELTSGMETDAKQGYGQLQEEIKVTEGRMVQGMDDFVGQIEHGQTLITNMSQEASTTLASIRQDAQQLLDEGAKEDASTGTTPTRKRRWEFVESWELTKKREELIKEWHQSETRRETESNAEQGPPTQRRRLENDDQNPTDEAEIIDDTQDRGVDGAVPEGEQEQENMAPEAIALSTSASTTTTAAPESPPTAAATAVDEEEDDVVSKMVSPAPPQPVSKIHRPRLSIPQPIAKKMRSASGAAVGTTKGKGKAVDGGAAGAGPMPLAERSGNIAVRPRRTVR